jgi:hypothetical protein
MRPVVPVGFALVALACRPLVMIPGGELSGSPEPAPSNWDFSDAIETVQLETRPGDPYSVNVWGVAVGQRFYVAAGDSESRWAQNIAENPLVRLKLGRKLYALKAERTQDPSELDAFLAAVKRKYDFEPDPEERAKATLFRLEPR